MSNDPLSRPTKKELLKAVFWNRWGKVVGTLLAIIGALDFIDSHFVPRFPAVAKAIWNSYYILPSFSRPTWFVIILAALLLVGLHGAYVYAIGYYHRFEKLTEHNLVFEIDQRRKSGTNVRVEKTKNATRIFVTLDLRFDNRANAPCYTKSIKLALHQRGDPSPVWMWFAVLQVTNNGNPISPYDFEPMRVDGHQLTEFYSVLFMLGTPDNDEAPSNEPLDLDANYFLRFSMESSGFQSVAIADLNPYWEAALREGGTNQIAIIGDAKIIAEDYSRID